MMVRWEKLLGWSLVYSTVIICILIKAMTNGPGTTYTRSYHRTSLVFVDNRSLFLQVEQGENKAAR
jgi:hypothetical protein